MCLSIKTCLNCLVCLSIKTCLNCLACHNSRAAKVSSCVPTSLSCSDCWTHVFLVVSKPLIILVCSLVSLLETVMYLRCKMKTRWAKDRGIQLWYTAIISIQFNCICIDLDHGTVSKVLTGHVFLTPLTLACKRARKNSLYLQRRYLEEERRMGDPSF